MRNNNYLNLINFEVKLHRPRLFLINEHFISILYKNSGNEAQWFCGGEEESGHAITILSKEP